MSEDLDRALPMLFSPVKTEPPLALLLPLALFSLLFPEVNNYFEFNKSSNENQIKDLYE